MQPLDKKQQAYNTIRELIISGVLKPGTFITQEEISKQIGMSRTPVKQAFLALDMEHVIELIPNRGAIVRELKLKEVIEIYEARALIEKKCVDILCKNKVGITDTMRNILAQMESCSDDELLKLDLLFHEEVVHSAANAVLASFYDGMVIRKLQAAFFLHENKLIKDHNERAEHKEIVLAIANHNADAAVKAIGVHLSYF